MVFNLVESGNSRQSQSENDSRIIQTLFDVIGFSDVEPSVIVKSHRLGKFDSTKRPNKSPLKLMLNSDHYVSTIVKNGYKVQSDSTYFDVRIARDQTPHQLKLYQQARH